MLLLSLAVIFNLWFYSKTPSKTDVFLVKKSAFFPAQRFRFSQKLYPTFIPILAKQKQESFFSEKDKSFQDPYLIFTVFVALMAMGIELIQSKNIRILQQHNQSLHFSNNLMLKQNNDLRNHLSLLEERTEENSKTLQIMVHDLRSPLAAIVGLAGFMIDENKLADEDMEVINLIHTSGIDSLNFINEILERKSAAMEKQKEMVDLQKLLTYCISQFRHKALEKDQQIVFENTTSVHLKLNREKMWRVINNLISNALKFSPHKSTVFLALHLVKEKAIISVKDQGIGIPENLREKIFGSNSQRKRTGTAGEKSFGMGLSIAKQIVDEHGGDLHFMSEKEKGTTFFVELPIP